MSRRQDQNVQGHLTRREVVRGAVGLTGLMVSGRLLAACGDDDASPSASSSGSTGPAKLGPANLKFLGWQGYDALPPENFPTQTDWMKQHEITVTSTYTDDNESMLTKIKASAPGTYDLTSPSHPVCSAMIVSDSVEPIDTDRMANFSKIYPRLRDLTHLRASDGSVYGIPFTFSYQVFLYRADRVEPIKSYLQLVDDPAVKKRYLLADGVENITWAAVALGLGNPDPHHLTRDELKKCQEVTRPAVSNARTISGSLGDAFQLITTGEVDWSISGTPDQPGKAQAAGVDVQPFFTSEGTQMYVDNYLIPKGSKNYDAALAWIDNMLSPGPQSEVAKVYSGAVVNPDAVSSLGPDLLALYDYSDLDAVFAAAPVYPEIPIESDEFATFDEWNLAWEQSK